MNIIIVIPNYNHGQALAQVLEKLEKYQLPCVIVDDGSQDETLAILTELEKKYPRVTIIKLNKNHGKGYAITQGMYYAKDQGFTHVLQIDADGQHDISDVALFVAKAKQAPTHFISGKPVYDESIPKSRLHGRKITNFWVAIETWSLSLKESMCGYRVYPLASTLTILSNTKLGSGMDFDTEILVRLYWAEVPVSYIATKVIYPENGISHFKIWRDNMVISKMHTKLFFAMIFQIPSLVRRKLSHA